MNTIQENDGVNTMRLFLALLPDEQVQARLLQWQAFVTGKKTPVENLHMTLFFLGNQSEEHLPAFKRFLDRLPFEPFDLMLDKIGFFSKIGLSWAGPSETPQELSLLFHKTCNFLVPAYIKDKSEHFRPHVTLARRSAKPDMNIPASISWKVRRIALMQSVVSYKSGQHPKYRILHEKTS